MDLPIRRDEWERQLRRHAIGLAVAFGSRATGRARPGSDLDVAVLRADGRPLSFRELGLLKLDLEAAADVDVDVLDLATADALVRFEVVRDGVWLHAPDRTLRTGFVARTLIDHDDIAAFLPAMAEGVRRAATRGR